MATIAAAAFGCPQFDCCCSISVATEPRPTLTIHANEGAKVHCSNQFMAGASGFNACSLCPCPCPCHCHCGLCELDVGVVPSGWRTRALMAGTHAKLNQEIMNGSMLNFVQQDTSEIAVLLRNAVRGERAKMQLAAHPRDRRTSSQNQN
ncbi:GM21739 [Drosophila sechellia]|uniref:GM21739 n=1 Tax=Drosophila sechellia TaxID=7238 RepID=B4HTB3_DROSE|nr:GM21739 [Drosophila sechellia]